MLRLHWRPTFLWHLKQRSHFSLPLLRIPRRVRRALIVQILRRFDLQRLFSEHLHNLKGQKAEDIDHVVVGSAVCDDAEAGPLSETLGFAEGK